MDRLRGGPLLCVVSLLALGVLATAQDSQVKRRLTPKEIEALPAEAPAPARQDCRPSPLESCSATQRRLACTRSS